MCEKNNSEEHSINHLELKDAEELPNLEIESLYNNRKLIDFNNNKWTFYFLEQEEIDFLENIAKKYKLPKIGDYANIGSGDNNWLKQFFYSR